MDVATYQAKVYPEPECWSLVTDVYLSELGLDPDHVETISESMRMAARVFRVQLYKEPGSMRQLQEPVDLAVVLMWPTVSRKRMHCGIYYDGKVLHATPEGVLYQDLASLQDTYQVMEFWGPAA